jgi:hypothetical protein
VVYSVIASEAMTLLSTEAQFHKDYDSGFAGPPHVRHWAALPFSRLYREKGAKSLE